MLDRVAASGKLDLTQGDPRDRRWWTRLGLALKQARFEQDILLGQSRFQYQLFSAMLCEPGSPGRGESYQHAIDEYEKLNKLVKPWLFKEVVLQDPRKQWQENFGIMGTQETQAAMDATLAFLNDRLPPIQEDF